MRVLRRLRVLLAVGALALAASAPAPALVQSAAVHPVPAISGHVLADLLTPPNTALCRANFGIACYQPFQLQKAYDLAPLFDRGIDGRGRTIVIVDAFGTPTIQDDLKTFDQVFGLPDPPSFQVIQPAGAVPPFPQDPFGVGDRLSWAGETTLDVEWAHVMAPTANILLVETPASETEGVQGFPEIVQAENFVIDHGLGDVISQSFGATEPTFPSAKAILDLRGAVLNARRHRVTMLASSGDQGSAGLKSDLSCCFPFPAVIWPSADPLVTSTGGTQLDLDDAGNRLSPDVVWPDGGGGVSTVFGRPAFQNDVRDSVGRARGIPDISLSSAVNGAVITFSSYPNPNGPNPTAPNPRFHLVAGTSEASPLFAGVVALADQAAGRRLGFLNQRLYEMGRAHASGIVDVTSGNNSHVVCASGCGTAQEQDVTVQGFDAVRGFDLASGWGTIDTARFVPELARRGGDDGSGGDD
ncbi:MAG TPA: S53 family peptidase [Candidatus Dormibacteraeota bacterium]|nr:S53 family peptidase [Candidatus Dormibacteraeota bacterium]